MFSERLLVRVATLMDKASPAIALDCAKVLAMLAVPAAAPPASAVRSEVPLRLTEAAAA